jgi:hypothetical protein
LQKQEIAEEDASPRKAAVNKMLTLLSRQMTSIINKSKLELHRKSTLREDDWSSSSESIGDNTDD